MIVAGVEPGTPAADAGLERGDIIRKVNGEPVKNSRDLLDRIASRRPGERVDLEVLREGRTFEVTVTLGSRTEHIRVVAGRENEERSGGEEGEEAGKAAAKRLGITVRPLTEGARAGLGYPADVEGVLVRDVEVGSVAEDEGIREHDVIAAVNGRPVRTLSDWNAAVRGLKEGQTVQLDVVRPARPQPLRRFVFLRVPRLDGNG